MTSDEKILEILRTRKHNNILTKEEENKIKDILREDLKNGNRKLDIQ